MLIRKLYKFESGHIVRNCNSVRCSHSEHGHSYKVEVFFKSSTLTPYGMTVDFGDFKTNIKEFLDRFDHSYHFWKGESEEFKEFHRKHDARHIELPFNPTAENYAIYFLKAIREMTKDLFDNKDASCVKVRVHETDTGYAEASLEDLYLHDYYNCEDVIFSEDTFNS